MFLFLVALNLEMTCWKKHLSQNQHTHFQKDLLHQKCKDRSITRAMKKPWLSIFIRLSENQFKISLFFALRLNQNIKAFFGITPEIIPEA